MKNAYPSKVYLNGEIVAADAAKVSVFDRAFLFGDGIYEVMVQINGHFLYKEAHLKRLREGLQKINIPFDTRNLDQEISRLQQASGTGEQDCLLYLQITRGVAPRKHAFPVDAVPTVMMYTTPIVFPEINPVHAQVVTSEDFRWTRCDIKMTSLLGNVLANEFATQQGCYETLLVREGRVTEGSHSNVFFVKDRIVYTHPADRYILNGITRQIVLEICARLGLEVREEAIDRDNIPKMDEAFLTGTTTQVASIKQVDDHYFYQDGPIGAITKMIQDAYIVVKA